MEKLKSRILQEGCVLEGELLKIDSFLNHQIDIKLTMEIGEELAKRFSDVEIHKILTVESSGIAIACATAFYADQVPVIFAKKSAPRTLTEGFYATEVTSFTKRKVSNVLVSKEFLLAGENVLIVDDFMAHGEATLGLARLVEQAGGKVAGIGVAVEKFFQGGSERLREKGYRVESLAIIESMEDCKVVFK